MRAKSQVKLMVDIPWRNDGVNWGGGYQLIYFMVNKAVGTVAANTWVLLSNSGHFMTNYKDIISYTNKYFLPLTINEDYQIRFFHQYRVYNNGTLYINQAHDLQLYVDNNLLQFGLSVTNAGYFKYIVEEIGG